MSALPPRFLLHIPNPVSCVWLAAAIGIAFSPAPLKAADQPQDPNKLVDASLKDFNAKKYDDALKEALAADKLAPNSPFVLNLVGAAYTRKKDYATAGGYFDKALAIQPDFFPAKFNVGETLFLQGKYTDALDYFQKLQEADPDNELLQFKCFLCSLLLGQKDDARKWLDQIPYPGDTPAWYYAQAAWEQKYGSRSQSSKYLNVAHVIYGAKTDIYDETFNDINFAH